MRIAELRWSLFRKEGNRVACFFPAQPVEKDPNYSDHQKFCRELNYYIDHARCHTNEEHGPGVSDLELLARQIIKLNPDMDVSRFYSEEIMELAREVFLMSLEKAMEAEGRPCIRIVATIKLSRVVGRTKPGRRDWIPDIAAVRFVADFDVSHWFEISAYPAVADSNDPPISHHFLSVKI